MKPLASVTPHGLRRRQIRWAAVVVGLLVTALAAAFLRFETGAFQRGLRSDLELQARVLEDHTARIVDAVDIIQRSIANVIVREKNSPQPVLLDTLLADGLRGRPFLRSLSLVDANGTVRASSNPANVGVSVPGAWRQVGPGAGEITRLASLASGRDLADLNRTPLVQSRLLVLPVLTPVDPLSGSTLVALINLDHFTTQFDRLLNVGASSDGASGMRALLIGLNGEFFTGSSGVTSPPGASMRSLPAFTQYLPQLESASGVGMGSDGAIAVGAFRVTRAWPLVVLVEQPHETWPYALRGLLGWTLAFLLASLALLGAATVVVDRSFRRDERQALDLWRANEETKNSDSRKLAILQSSLDAIVTVGADGQILEFNASAERMFGRSAADAIGQPMHEMIVPPHHRPAHQAGMARYQATGVAHVLNRRIEIEAMRADGTLFPVELTIVPIQTAEGDIFTATLRDITERLRVEQALRDSEARANATFDQAAVGVLQQAFDRRLLRVNQKLCTMLGYTREELLALRAEDIVHPDDFAAVQRRVQELIAGATENFASDRRYRQRDGRWLWARITLSLARDAQEKPLYLIGIVEDITARRKAELALQESQALLEKTGSIGGVGGWTLELGDQVARWTNQTAVIHDLPPGHQPASLEEALSYYAPGAAKKMAQALQRATETGEGFDLELPLITARRRSIWVRAVGKPEYENDQPVRLVGALQDITERRIALRELGLARERELTVGSRIQQTLLVEPPDQRLPGLWLATLNQASQGIDGDFVELIKLGDNGVDIIVGDVMGKGVAAALMAAATKMQFSRCVAELLASPAKPGQLPTPAEVVAAVHRAMTINLQALEAFVTLSYVRLDTHAGTVTWVGCGNEEPLLLRASGEVVALTNQHTPMGIIHETTFHQTTLPFHQGDAVFMSSDGAADALMPDGSRLGRERVTQQLTRILHEVLTPAAALHVMRKELLESGARITDDLTLALAMSGGDTIQASRRELMLGLNNLPDVRGLVGARCLQAGLDEVDASLFTVACVEAYSNAVRHTVDRPKDSPIELVVRVHHDKIVVDIVTLGKAFSPQPELVDTDFATFPEGGFGLHIMKQAAHDLEHLHARGVNTVRLTRQRSAT